MKVLGKIPQPEQYYPVDDCFLISDSLEAMNFFNECINEEDRKDGAVCLVNAYFNSMQYPSMVLWAYISLSKKKILVFLPVFKIDHIEALNNAKILKFDSILYESYFDWNGVVYAAVITEDGEIAVRRVRMLLLECNVCHIVSSATGARCDEAKPVKLFQLSTGRFLGIFWKCSIDDDFTSFEVACLDELPDGWDDELLHDSYYQLLNIDDRVIMDHSYYSVEFDANVGIFLKKLPFVASDDDRKKEDVPQNLFKNNMQVVSSERTKPSLPKPGVGEEPKSPVNNERQSAKIVSFRKKSH